MFKFQFPLLIVFSLLVLPHWCMAQIDQGHGHYESHAKEACLKPEDRQAVKQRIARNIAQLKQSGLLPARQPVIPSFGPPLEIAEELPWANIFGIANFVDHNPATGSQDWNSYGVTNQDYNCGVRTYDINTGYNHAGTDYFTWPFPWYLYENDLARVIACDAGIVIGKDDGHFDKNCECTGSWNAVYIRHSDGSQSWYGHLKNGSLTSKKIGDRIEKGEYLGIVASSGCSTGPHLHLEVYDRNSNLIDPYSGSCNDTATESWWTEQSSYRTPRINTLLTHSEPPRFGCPDNLEFPMLENQFFKEEQVSFGSYFQDQLAGQIVSYRVRYPNGNVWQTWLLDFSQTFNASWWWRRFTLPASAPCGEWIFEAEYKGTTYQHVFYVGQQPDVELSIAGDFVVQNDVQDYSVFNPTPGSIFDWQVVNGEILGSSRGSSISVRWTASEGDICVKERTRSGCSGQQFCESISGSVQNSSVDTKSFSLRLVPGSRILELICERCPSDYRLMAINGQTLAEGAIVNQQINLDHIQSGVYVLSVIMDGEVYSQKVMLN